MALTQTQVSQLYVAIFGRASEGEGNEFWQNSPGSMSDIANAMLDTTAASDYFGTTLNDNQAFIEFIYENTLGKTVAEDPNGIAFWVSALDNGTSKGQVVTDLIDAVYQYENSTDPVTKAAYDQFVNRVDISNYTADNIYNFDGQYEVFKNINNSVTDTDASKATAQAQVDAYISPGHIFTLKENITVEELPDTIPTQTVTYWGYNPHAHDETNVDNTDGNDAASDSYPDQDANASGNENNLTNEGPMDGGVPVSELLSYIVALAGADQNYAAGVNDLLAKMNDIGVIDGAIEQGAPDFSNVTSLSFNGDASSMTIAFENDAGEIAQAEVELGELYTGLIHDLIFDSEGNSRLFEKEVPYMMEMGVDVDGDGSDDAFVQVPVKIEGEQLVTINPVVLTTTANNGGTEEAGYTTIDNDLIVAGRLELVHGAYIDGGTGVNTLEIDAKGYFAQPKELLNIQNIVIENLPNVYTDSNDGSNDYPMLAEDPSDGYVYNDEASPFDNSIIDISRAGQLESLTITEGAFEGLEYNDTPGDLTVTGVRADAVLTLEGGFTQDLTVHYSEGLSVGDDGVDLVLRLGDTEGATFDILQNAATINIDSQGGGNAIDANFTSSSLMNMNIAGDAKLQITNDLAINFQAGHPATIDASANTAGVDLTMGGEGEGFSDEIVFTGTAESDDHFNAYSGKSVLINGGNGNNEFVANTVGANMLGTIDITSGDGNNEITASADHEQGDVTIVVGDGMNHIDASNGTNNATVSVTAGDGENDITAFGDTTLVTAGNGGNIVDVNGSNEATVTTGTGDDNISAQFVNSATVDAGDGNNTVTAYIADAAAITTGAGDDMVTIAGANAGEESYTASDATINVDMGAGANTLVLGTDDANIDNADLPGISALAGSSITGSDITLIVNKMSDLSNASLSGITSVVLTNTDDADSNDTDTDTQTTADSSLVLTAEQFGAIGAENFSVEGSEFGQIEEITLVITSDTNLSDIADFSTMSPAIKLFLQVADGATVTMTAEELHHYIAPNGISVDDSAVNGYIDNQVVITDAGLNFNPFGQQNNGLNGGTVDNSVGTNDVSVIRATDGFERPEEDEYSDVLTIDSDETPVVGDVVSPYTDTVEIIGSTDISYEGEFTLGNGFTIDFSEYAGAADVMTISQFENIANADTTGDNVVDGSDNDADIVFGEIIGNNANNRINIEVSDGSRTGYDDITKGGFKSSGVQTYVVTDILAADGSAQSQAAGGSAEIYVCDQTQDLEVLGLQNNRNGEVTFSNVNWGTEILMEGDGYADASDQEKNLGNPDLSEIGKVIANFFESGANAVVNINNQGTALGMNEDAEDGYDINGERILDVAGIELNNADRLEINVEDGDAVVNSVDASDVEVLLVNGSEDVTLIIDDLGDMKAIDASGVVGSFTIQFNEDTDLSGATLTGIDSIVLGDAVELTLSADQVLDYGSTISETNGNATLHVNDFSTQAIDLSTIDVNNIGTVTTADVDGTIIVDDAVNFGDADELIITALESDTTLQMTADQYHTYCGDTLENGLSVIACNTDQSNDATLMLTDLANDESIDLTNVDQTEDTGNDPINDSVDVTIVVDGITATSDFEIINGTYTLEVSGDNDLSAGNIGGTAAFNFVADGTLTLDADQVANLDTDSDGNGIADAFEGSNAGGHNVVLDIVDVNTQGLDLDLIEAAGIDIGTLTLTDDSANAAITLGAVSMGNADEIITPTADDDDGLDGIEDTVLNMTFAQFEGLEGAGTISGGSLVNISGIVNNFDTDGTDNELEELLFDASGITAMHGTMTLGDDVVTMADASDLGTFSIDLDDGQLIRFANEAQASRDIINVDPTDITGVQWMWTTFGSEVETSGYDSDITTLFIDEALLASQDREEDLWSTLASEIVVEKINGDTIPQLIQLNRTNTFEALTNISGGVNYDDSAEFSTVANLTMNLEGEVNIGSVLLGDTQNGDGSSPGIDGVGYLDTLTINSYLDTSNIDGYDPSATNGINLEANHVGDISLNAGTVDELIDITINTYDSAADGVLTDTTPADGVPDGTDIANGDFSTDDGGFYDLENVNGAEAERPGLEIEVGTITVAANNAGTTATLTLTGAEDATIAGVDLSDANVDMLHIDLSAFDGAATIGGVEYTDFNIGGTGTDLENVYMLDGYVAEAGETIGTANDDLIEVVNGNVDLTAATLSVEAVHVSGDATITLTDAQIQAIGEGNFSIAPGVNVTLNVTELANNTDIDLNTIQDAGFNIGTVTTTDADVTLNDAATLGGADNVVVLLDDNDRTFTLTAEQYTQITNGNITENDIDPTTTEQANVVVTDLDGIATDTDSDGTVDTVDIDLSTVLTTGTKQVQLADAGTAADLTMAATSDLGDFAVILDSIGGNTAAEFNNLDGQTVRFTNATQAERAITVNNWDGGNDNGTNVVWLFDTITGTATAGKVDTASYDQHIGRVWMTEDLVKDQNVEELYTDLHGDIIIRVVNADDLDNLLLTAGFNRTVEIESYTDLTDNGTVNGDLTFSDVDESGQPLDFVENLTVDLGGEVTMGAIAVDNVLADPIDNDDEFDTLTINSLIPVWVDANKDGTAQLSEVTNGYLLPELPSGEFYGTNTGETPLPTDVNTIGDIMSGSTTFDLGSVIINTGTAGSGGNDLVGGTVYFSDDGDGLTGTASGSTAEFEVQGDGDVTLKSLDTSDADITALNVTTGTGTLTITGGSPAFDGGDATGDTETLTIATQLGSTTNFGYDAAGVINTDGTNPYAGVAGADLTLIDLSGGGDVNLGYVAQVDSESFYVTPAAALDFDGTPGDDTDGTAFTGTSTMTLGAAMVNGTLTAPELSATGTWSIEVDTLTVTSDVVFNAGGTLSILNTAITFEGPVDLSGLTLDMSGSSIEVAAGSTLTLTPEQADGLTITGDGDVVITTLDDTMLQDTVLSGTIDLSGIMTNAGDTGTVAMAVDSTGDMDLSTSDMGVAHTTISGTGTVDASTATTTPVDRNATATPADVSDDTVPAFTVGTGSTLNIAASQAGNATGTAATSWALAATGAGAVTVEDLALNADADLSGLATTGGVTAVTNTVTFTGDLGTAVVTVNDLQIMTTSYTIATGHTINHDGTENAQGLVITISDSPNDESAADLSTITSDITNFTASFIDDGVDQAITFTGNLDGKAATVATGVDLTVSAAIADGETITGLGTADIIITDLATNLAVDLSGITSAGTATAAFDADGTFTGDLGTVTVTIADGVTMTASATVLVGADVNKSGAGANDGAVVVTVSSADNNYDADDADGDADTSTGTFEEVDLNLDNIIGGATGAAADITSITVTDDITFRGTMNTAQATLVADGATLSTTAAIAAASGQDIDKVAGGTTGAANIDMSVDADQTLRGSADFTVTGLVSDLTANAISGSLNVTVAADAAMNVDLGSGTNTIDALALTTGQILTVEDSANNEAGATVTTEDGDINASTIVDNDADSTTGGLTLNGGNGTNTIQGTANDDIIDGGVDDDTLTGGDGDDTFIIDASLDLNAEGGETINGGNDTDTVVINTTNAVDLSKANSSNLEILDLSNVDADVTITGAQLNDFSGATGLVQANTSDDLTIDTLTGLTLDATGATDTFVFLATDAGVSITGFASTTDKVDVQAFGDSDNAVATIAANQTLNNNDVFYTSGVAGDADSAAASAAAITAAGAAWTETGTVAYFVIADDDSSAIYEYNQAAADGTIATGELTLIGTLDTAIVAGDIIA